MVTSKRFYQGLAEKYDLTQQEIKESGYRYAGGDKTVRHKKYLILIKKNDNFTEPAHEDHCVCGHPIEENCFIRSESKDHTIVLGNCCIKKFIPFGLRRTCSNCQQIHTNRTYNTCKSCKRTEYIRVQLESGKIRICDTCGEYHRKITSEICRDCIHFLSLTV